MEVNVQALAPPVGSLEVTTSRPEAPTHHDVDRQDTLESPAPTLLVVHAAAPPVGFVEVITLPELSTTTHSVADGQETPFR